MKYMLLIHQGTTPTPPSDEWESLSEAYRAAVYEDYKAISETAGVSPGVQLQACAASVAPRRPATPTAARWRWPTTAPSGACSSGGSRSSARRRAPPGGDVFGEEDDRIVPQLLPR
jgi:hypothetical protein